jgi:hypothetical protein
MISISSQAIGCSPGPNASISEVTADTVIGFVPSHIGETPFDVIIVSSLKKHGSSTKGE